MILTARVVDAEEALRLGLVTRLSADSVVDDALAIAETLCGYGKFGLESTKQVMWANLEASKPRGGAARGEPQPDPGVDRRRLGAASAAFRHRQR